MTVDLDLALDPIEYRTASHADIPALVAIAGACTEVRQRFSAPLIEYMASQPSCRLFVADAGPIVGFVAVQKRRTRTGEIVAIDVAPEARRLDIGTALMARGEEWLAIHGAQSIYLEVDAGNEPAIALYAKLGYVPREGFDEDGTTRYLMEKHLGGIGSPRLRIRK